MRFLYIAIGFVVFGVIGFFILNNFIYTQKQAPIESATDEVSHNFQIIPISHASLILHFHNQVIYNDPVGSEEAYLGQSAPNLVLISDIHPDHLNLETLKKISNDNAIIIAPQVVVDRFPSDIPGQVIILANNESTLQNGINIQAIPMYNVPEKADASHVKGRGNGYILEAGGERIYIAGDTGPTKEMKELKNINVAFIPMNLLYTMSVEEAANAVVAFRPKKAIPYHYRGPEGLSDTEKFKELVEAADQNIQVELLNFYPE